MDPEKCTGCGTCQEVCPMAVFELREGLSVVVNEDDCIACKACEVQCPAEAIKVTE